jgi:hypothetical protein
MQGKSLVVGTKLERCARWLSGARSGENVSRENISKDQRRHD